ncbi:hypothetical protein C8R45DRAFT_1077697 [Mycena sanguinolenta]|nr:hypothetical protein C8R45DRAFT_1077697 [Mycena sanguinolenta]
MQLFSSDAPPSLHRPCANLDARRRRARGFSVTSHDAFRLHSACTLASSFLGDRASHLACSLSASGTTHPVSRRAIAELIIIYLLRPASSHMTKRAHPQRGAQDPRESIAQLGFIGTGWSGMWKFEGACPCLSVSSFFLFPVLFRSFLVAFALWSPAGGRARRGAPLRDLRTLGAARRHPRCMRPPRTSFYPLVTLYRRTAVSVTVP